MKIYANGKSKAIELLDQVIKTKDDVFAMKLRAQMYSMQQGCKRNYVEEIKLHERILKSTPDQKKYIKDAFQAPLDELKKVSELLKNKAKNNKKYEALNKTLDDICTQLKPLVIELCENPTEKNVNELTNFCLDKFADAKEQAKSHRGWHSIPAILRGILGLLAALTIVPAVVVSVSTKHGFTGTFSKQPSTDTSEQLKAIDDGLWEIISAVKTK